MLRKRVISRLVAIQCRQAFYYFIFLVCAFAYMGILLPAAWAAKKPAHHSSRISPKKPDYTSESSIEGQLKKYLGVAYRRGGCTWNGMDCSGFTKVIYREVFGVDIPHGSVSQHALPTMQKISLEDLRTGDLIFFSPNRKKRRINHVGVYLSDGRFIHATPKNGVIVSSLSEPYWKAKIYAAKKIVNVDFPGHDVPANVSADLALAPKPSDAITIQFTGFAPPSPVLGRERNSVFDEPRTDLLSSQLGWQKSLFIESSDFLLSAFREYYYLREPTGSYDLSGKNQDDSFSLHTSDFSFVQGIRMASDFEPLRGLTVTPSLTYFSYGGQIDDVDLPMLTY